MTVKMQELCNKRAELQNKGKALVAENKLEELEQVNIDLAKIDNEINTLEKFEKSAKDNISDEKTVDNKKGFKNFAEQLKAVKNAAYGRIDERLVKNDLSGGLNTNNGADGGYAIQSDFIGAILDKAFERSQILNDCDIKAITSDSNRANWVMLDDSNDASKSGVVVAGGVQAYWVGEGESVLKSKPKYKNEELKLAKAMGICYVTEEMLADVPFTAQVVEDSFSDAISGLLTNGIINGLGDRVGQAPQPYGVMNSNALVTVTASGTTITAKDLLAMKSRMRPKNWANAKWYMHPDLQAELPLIKDDSGNLLFIPAGGLNGYNYDTLLGRPVVYDEFMGTRNTKGDILLADFSQYQVIKKGEERKDWSIHVAFLTDEQVFRIVLRVNGKPKNNTTYAVRNSSVTRGAFVTLSARGVKLSAPVVNITSNTASWTAIQNATGYTYSINGGQENTITTTSVASIPSGATIKVKANGNGSTYVDSDYATATNDTL